jgi:rhizoxin synthesis polyketide synthase RhiF
MNEGLLAQRANRPFYGIQAKGYMTKEKPLNGIVNIATYYIEMIRSVQAKGPYDLGGYCIGGVISYEIAKQLQKMGEKVNSIVMIDSPDPLVLKKLAPSQIILIDGKSNLRGLI